MRSLLAPILLLLAACGSASSQTANVPTDIKADRLLVDESERVLIAYAGNREITRYTNIRFGDAPTGHKQFEGDERTPEGRYRISGRNPKSAYHLSLRISYPNAADRAHAKAERRSPGGDIFIHGGPKGRVSTRDWTWGCVALTDKEIEIVYSMVKPGTPVFILP